MFRDCAQTRRFALAGLVLASLVASPGSRSWAGVVSGTSQAYDANVNLTATVLNSPASFSASPAVDVSGTAPSPYSNSAASAPFNATMGSSTGTLGPLSVSVNPASVDVSTTSNSASSTVTGGPGSQTTSSSISLSGLNVSLLNATGNLGTFQHSVVGLSITADSITSSSTVTGDYGSLVASGSVSVNDLVVQAFGVTLYQFTGVVPVNDTISITPSKLVGSGSATLTFGEQTITGNGITSAGISENFLDLSLNNFGVTLFNQSIATLNGDIVIGHSDASMVAADPVPEPSSIILATLGGLVVSGAALRRRYRAG